jgi:hypothetical protein
MAKTFSQLRATIDANPERRFHMEQHKHAIRDALALSDLRAARAATQQQVAAAMGETQANISRIEHQDDLYLSTLRTYIEALGGQLEIAAVFPDQRILLTGRATQAEPDIRAVGGSPAQRSG